VVLIGALPIGGDACRALGGGSFGLLPGTKICTGFPDFGLRSGLAQLLLRANARRSQVLLRLLPLRTQILLRAAFCRAQFGFRPERGVAHVLFVRSSEVGV